MNLSQDIASLHEVHQRAVKEAANKADLVKAAANKGPKAMAAAVETAKKAAKRRDRFAAQLAALGAQLD